MSSWFDIKQEPAAQSGAARGSTARVVCVFCIMLALKKFDQKIYHTCRSSSKVTRTTELKIAATSRCSAVSYQAFHNTHRELPGFWPGCRKPAVSELRFVGAGTRPTVQHNADCPSIWSVQGVGCTTEIMPRRPAIHWCVLSVSAWTTAGNAGASATPLAIGLEVVASNPLRRPTSSKHSMSLVKSQCDGTMRWSGTHLRCRWCASGAAPSASCRCGPALPAPPRSTMATAPPCRKSCCGSQSNNEKEYSQSNCMSARRQAWPLT